MGYVPKDAKWFLAEIVIEIIVEGDPRNVVHTNWVLIEAGSPEVAYEKALLHGKAEDSSYLNPSGKQVQSRFRGLRNLDCIHDDLEDGCEIFFEQKIGVEETQIQGMLRAKEQLEVFRPFQPITPGKSHPDYADKDIVDELESMGFPRPTSERDPH